MPPSTGLLLSLTSFSYLIPIIRHCKICSIALSTYKMAPVKYFLVGAGLMMSVMADYIAFSEWPTSLTAGQPVTLKWTGGSDAVSRIKRKSRDTFLGPTLMKSTAGNNHPPQGRIDRPARRASPEQRRNKRRVHLDASCRSSKCRRLRFPNLAGR